MKPNVVDIFCLHVSHSLSWVIYKAIYAVRGCLSIPLCCTLWWVHTAFTNTHTLRGLTFINAYDKLMVDCRKNIMCLSLFFLIFPHYRRLLRFFLCGSTFIHISAEHSHFFHFKLLNCKKVTYTQAPFELYFTEPSRTTSAFTSHRAGEWSYHITCSCT